MPPVSVRCGLVSSVRAGAVALGCVAAFAVAAPQRPGLISDISDSALAKLRRAPAPATPEATLDAVLAATTPYAFLGEGLQVVTDTRWFQVSSVDGPGAPALEVRHRDTLLDP